MEGDLYNLYRKSTPGEFQSTPSVWRETLGATVDFGHWVFQSTPSGWRETVYGLSGNVDLNISIHSLRMEGDSDLFGDDLEEEEFQSTPSAWRETQYCILSPHSVINFNPLPPHGGRLATPSAIRYCSKFQSTPSAWRETYSSGGIWGCLHISIHSLRMEGDSFNTSCAARCSNFNPLPPHGGRPSLQSAPDSTRNISIHSLRMEGDRSGKLSNSQIHISIHSLRMEGDRDDVCHETKEIVFQSTPSAWRETWRVV